MIIKSITNTSFQDFANNRWEEYDYWSVVGGRFFFSFLYGCDMSGFLLDNNIQADVIFLDFAKAFDSVDHNILLTRLCRYRISGNLYSWFSSYLCGLKQRVAVEGIASEWSPVTSGVSQGSILGPMLYLLFSNDLPDVIPQTTSTGLYADDAKLHRVITSNEDSA